MLSRRFVFRDCVESCVVAVHEKIKAGVFKVTDKAFSRSAAMLLCEK